MTGGVLRLALRARMFASSRHWRRVDRLAGDPAGAQRDVLTRILHANQATRFGVEHAFRMCRTPDDFGQRVPVQQYETLSPYILEQRTSGTPSLTAEAPLFYAQTSGTTGARKYIPITPTMLAMQRDEQTLFSYLQYRACPGAFEGKALGIMGAAVEETLESGHAVGSVSGHLYRSLPGAVRARFVVPPEVFGIADYSLKYLVILRLALAEPGITYMGSPNPSTFLRLLELLTANREMLIDSVASGRVDRFGAIDPGVRASLAPRLRADAERARALGRLTTLAYVSVWPGIRLVTTWTGGSCGIALAALRGLLPPQTAVMELGYQSSECRGTIALDPERPEGLPPLHHHYFEFVEPERWDAGHPEFLGLHQLEAHRRYYVLFTTIAGLYRYFINDLVEVCGFHHRTPLLRFVQKGKGVTSLTGEKLYEAQVIEAVHDVSGRHGFSGRFFVMVADERLSAYTLFVEAAGAAGADASAVAAEIDVRLGELNIEYRSKRESGRLPPLGVAWLADGAAEAYKAACVKAGQREVQFKPPVLQYRKDLALAFDGFLRA